MTKIAQVLDPLGNDNWICGLTQTSPSAGSNVTVLPGYLSVPLWSVLPI